MSLFIRATFLAIAVLVAGAVLTANIGTFAQLGLDSAAYAKKKPNVNETKTKIRCQHSNNCN